MTQLPLEEAIPRFKSNEERVDIFTNGDDETDWMTTEGDDVPSIQKFLRLIRLQIDEWGATTFTKQLLLTTSGVRRYTTDNSGVALTLTETNHILFGGSPFGPLTYGVDYAVYDGGITFAYDPGSAGLFHIFSMPRFTNSEAQVILQDFKDVIGDDATRAETARTAAETAAANAQVAILDGDVFDVSGPANAFTLTPRRPLPVLRVGARVRWKATVANTGATSLTIPGIGTYTCRTFRGTALPAGYIRTDVFTEAEFHGTNFVLRREVEYTTDANGDCWRYENGVQKCTIVQTIAFTTTASGNVYRDFTSAPLWTFPKPFVAAPIHTSFEPQGSSVWGAPGSGGAVSIATRALFTANPITAANVKTTTTAEGFWY